MILGGEEERLELLLLVLLLLKEALPRELCMKCITLCLHVNYIIIHVVCRWSLGKEVMTFDLFSPLNS